MIPKSTRKRVKNGAASFTRKRGKKPVPPSGQTEPDQRPFTLSLDEHGWCYSCFKEIAKGARIYQRDDRDVCEKCNPLYDNRERKESGRATSKPAFKGAA